MQVYNKFYKAVFNGKVRKNLKINRFNFDEVLKVILEYIPKNDDGFLDIYVVDFKTREKTFLKKLLIVSELFLEEENSSY